MDDDDIDAFGAGDGIKTDDELLVVLFSLDFTASDELKLNCRVTSSRVFITALVASPLSKGFGSIIGSFLISLSFLMDLLLVSTVNVTGSSSILIGCSNVATTIDSFFLLIPIFILLLFNVRQLVGTVIAAAATAVGAASSM